MAGAPITDGMVVITNGKVAAVGAASAVRVPPGYPVLSAKVVTRGLVDAQSAVGLTGYLNAPTDQDQLETSAAIQPELRAVDAYDPDERLIEWVRSFGVTTMNTGHAPGALVSGQLMIVKTRGRTVEDATLKPVSMVAASLGELGQVRTPGKGPGTRAKEMALLREQFIKAQEYQRKLQQPPSDKDKEKGGAKPPDRDLHLEVFARILKGDLPLLVTANRARDIMSALRLLEAAIAAANGLTFEQALAGITIDAAKLIGVSDRVGSLETGKDGDVALYDGDPFEYTSHCVGTVINGKVVLHPPVADNEA
jgi:imidazolonepropionase-like amidohydrolase